MNEKSKRQTRFQQKAAHIGRQLKLALNIFYKDPNTRAPDKDQPHRMAKRSFATCGDSNCVMCGNPRKFFGHKTIQEQKQAEYADSFDKDME